MQVYKEYKVLEDDESGDLQARINAHANSGWTLEAFSACMVECMVEGELCMVTLFAAVMARPQVVDTAKQLLPPGSYVPEVRDGE